MPDIDKAVSLVIFLLSAGLIGLLLITAIEVLWPEKPKK